MHQHSPLTLAFDASRIRRETFGSRPAIGYVTAHLHGGVAGSVWAGVLDAAERHDVDLLCFPGGVLGQAPGQDSPRAVVYDLIDPDLVDGLICWASPIGPVGALRPRWSRRLRAVPAVSLTQPFGDGPTLVLDGYDGMRAVIAHLVQEHGIRRPAFIRGPEGHPFAQERYSAYAEALLRHRIPPDPARVSPPLGFDAEGGAAAMRVLVHGRRLRPVHDFDAVVACSDLAALGALDVLRAARVDVPGEVAVTGFNDSPEAGVAAPPLTTVTMPFREQGALAVDLLLGILRGESAATRIVLSPTLVVRESCGCPSPPAARTAGERATDRGEGAHGERWRSHVRHLLEVGEGLAGVLDPAALADALAARLPRAGVPGCYLSLYETPGVPLGRARLVMAYDARGRRAIDPPGPSFPSRRLVPPRVLARDRRHSLVVEPVHAGEDHAGFILFEVDPDGPLNDGAVYAALSAQIGTALRRTVLFRDLCAARDAARNTDEARTRLLANVGQELRGPLQEIVDRADEIVRVREPVTPSAVLSAVGEIRDRARQEMGVVDDLLDLARAEIDTSPPSRELIDPRPVLDETFRKVAEHPHGDTHGDIQGRATGCAWHLRLPARLPVIWSDRHHFRRILTHLFEHAAIVTAPAHLTVRARVAGGGLRIRVEGTGYRDGTARRTTPFQPGGAGALSLSVARRLVTLHGGQISQESRDGQNVVEVSLPLPSLADRPLPAPPGTHAVLVALSASGHAAPDIVEMSRRAGLRIRFLSTPDDVDLVFQELQPTALAFDLASADPDDWVLVRRLRDHPRGCHTPFALYGLADSGPRSVSGWEADPDDEPAATLAALLDSLRPAGGPGPVLVVDGDGEARECHREMISASIPGSTVRVAADGAAALSIIADETPRAVVLDPDLPDMDGLDLLERLRSDHRLRHVPVVLVTGRPVTSDTVRRLEPHGGVTLHSKGVQSVEETVEALRRIVSSPDRASRTSRIVRQTLAYLHQNYQHQLTRRRIAQAVGVSEDYLSRMFHRELAISPWDYLNRLRISQAKKRLSATDESIQLIARRVGFRDRAYFSRVFRKITGVAPHTFREQPVSCPTRAQDHRP